MPCTSEDDRTSKLQGCDSQGRLWLSRALETLQHLEKDSKHVSLAVGVDDEIVADRAKASKALKAVREVCSCFRTHGHGTYRLLRLLGIGSVYRRQERCRDLAVIRSLADLWGRCQGLRESRGGLIVSSYKRMGRSLTRHGRFPLFPGHRILRQHPLPTCRVVVHIGSALATTRSSRRRAHCVPGQGFQ